MQDAFLGNYSKLTGIGVRLVCAEGKILYSSEQYREVEHTLLQLADLFGVTDSLDAVTLRNMALSVEYGGLNTFLDPCGLVYAISPVVKNGGSNQFIIGGPIILSSVDDFIEYTLSKHAGGSICSEALRDVVAKIPVCSPATISAFSEQLYVNAVFPWSGKDRHASLEFDEPEKSVLHPQATKAHCATRFRVRYYMYDDVKKIRQQYQLLKVLLHHEESLAKPLHAVVLRQILYCTRNNMDTIKWWMEKFIYAMASSAVCKGVDENAVRELLDYTVIDMEKQQTLDEIVIWLHRIIKLFSKCVIRNPQSKHAHIIIKSLEYMRQNYEKKITLNDVAAFVSFSPTYLCTLFKTETGQNFKSFLSRMRVERSKELISSSDLTIAEISHAIGFADQSHFTRVFKQLEGVTPYEFRLTCKPTNSQA